MSQHPAKLSDHVRRRSAFSLIEVILALALFGLAATVLANGMVTALTLRDRPASRSLLAEDVRFVRQQLLLEPNPEDARRGAEILTVGGGRAVWSADIEASEVINLFRVDLRIRFSDGGPEYTEEHTETLWLLRPTWSRADERSTLLEDKRREYEQRRDLRAIR